MMGKKRKMTGCVILGCLAALLHLPSCSSCEAEKGPSGAAIQAYGGGGPNTAVSGQPARQRIKAPPKRRPARQVRVTVVRGMQIPDKDPTPLTGLSDPYVRLDYDGASHRTGEVKNSSSPSWGDSFVFSVREGGVLMLTLMDGDAYPKPDDQIGVSSETMPRLFPGESKEMRVMFGGGSNGIVLLRLEGLR